MVQKYCPNCGHKLQAKAKFCDNCGQETGTDAPAEKPKRRTNWGVLFFVLAIVFSGLGTIASSSPNKSGQQAASVFFVVGGFLYLGAVLAFLRWLFRKNKKLTIALLVALIILSSFTVVYYQTKQAYLSQISAIEDIGAEIAYAKSVGDDLVAGRKVANAGIVLEDNGFGDVLAQEKITTTLQVRSKLERESNKIKTKRVKSEIEPYRNSVATWSSALLDASNFKNPQSLTREERATWQKLPETPAVVSMNLRDDQQTGALDSVSSRIKQLQSSGDLAIAGKDQSSMRLVASRALMQSNFVESLTVANPNICSKRGCAPEVKSFVGGVYRSAHNYVVGNQSAAAAEWDKTWDTPPEIIAGAGTPLGGLGITQGSPDATPPPNKPTRTASVSPDYKPRQGGGASWDGTYSSTANVSCDTASSDFADTFANSSFGNFEVRGNKILGGALEIAIDSSGHASYNANIAGFNVTSDYYFVQTGGGGGVAVSGNFSLYGGAEGVSVSCSGDFSGSRISL
ncbi:hypothetical protein A2W45_02345 [Candidatus Curtissbacteria bacterium RIFCSPHIGHO2_12_41_11]|uniref:Zinc-ribbon domain-containing protein n=1 Tax=Candidatus Curtissbacteria bacterium RIFCSPHIGHO2_12_41_11 TaxID=1797718 RepID=A0A1F5H775_9BACT|nr:MAG: hypothetical protein A2W45_02345 [Candidatus Curtissbacteria bacterium RIFCSPHIGHO2_12_41_11]